MGTYNRSFGSWTDPTGINDVSIADNATDITNEISMEGLLGIEVGLEVTYGATLDEGMRIQILKEVNGTYEAIQDEGMAWLMPTGGGTSTKHVDSEFIPAVAAKIKVQMENQTGAQCTNCRVRYKKVTGVTT